jgi:hypothetical protein
MHPYAKHKEAAAGKSRAKHLTSGYKKGGAVHSDEAMDRKLIKKMLAEEDKGESKAPGKASGGRIDKFASGGRTKKKGNTNINIIVAPQTDKGEGDAAPGPMVLPPPDGGMPPMGPPPGAGGPPAAPPNITNVMPPGAGGPGPSPGSPASLPPGLRKQGGRVNTYAKGGKVPMKAGAETGVGRKDKVKAYGKNARKG